MKGKRQGSILIAVLCIFVLVSAFALIVYNYAMNNLQQAKIQEENMRAYYLAYSGCEMAYAALVQESGGKWEHYLSGFSKKDQILKKSDLNILDDNDSITIQIEKVSDTSSQFKGWVEIKSTGKSNEKSRFPGEKVKYLYVSPKDHKKLFWK